MKSPKMEVDKFYRDEDVGTLLPHYKFYNQKFISDKTSSFINVVFQCLAR